MTEYFSEIYRASDLVLVANSRLTKELEAFRCLVDFMNRLQHARESVARPLLLNALGDVRHFADLRTAELRNGVDEAVVLS